MTGLTHMLNELWHRQFDIFYRQLGCLDAINQPIQDLVIELPLGHEKYGES